MKIMQICFTPIVDSAGGAEKVFCNMANHFCEKHDVVNVCCDNKVGAPFYELNKNVKFVNLAGVNNIIIPKFIKFQSEVVRLLNKIGISMTMPKVKYLRSNASKRLKHILEEESPDVVMCYDLNAAMALKYTGFPTQKIIVMFHSKIEKFLDNITSEEVEFLKKVRFNQVLLQSDKNKLEILGFKNVVRIGNIVPKFNIDTIKARERVILHVGRLDKKIKRQHLAIEAFAKIAAKYPDWTMKFIGGNSNPPYYETELKNLIKKYGLEKQVILVGTSDKVADELLKASIFVFPSAFEGFGLAMTEAMSAGLPVLGFRNTPAVNELVVDGKTGFLSECNNSAFTVCLEKMMNNDSMRVEMGRMAIESVKVYSADVIYGKWDSVIKNIIKESENI